MAKKKKEEKKVVLERYLQSKRDDVKTLGIIPQTKEVVMYCPRVGNQVLSPSQ